MMRVGMLCLIVMVLGQTYEVILRYVFGKSTGIMDEIVSQGLVGLIVTGIGYTMREDGHVRITILTDRLPVRIRQYMFLVGMVFGLIATFLAVYFLFGEALDSYRNQVRSLSPLNTLLYIPQAALGLGFAVLAWEQIKEITSSLCVMKNT